MSDGLRVLSQSKIPEATFVVLIWIGDYNSNVLL